MRWFVPLLFALTACGGSSKATPDLSAQGDFALPVVSKCLGVVACAAGCNTTDCVSSCEVPADPASVQAYEALASCAEAACEGGADAGLCGANDTTCKKCVDDAVHGKGTTCSAEYAACASP